MPVGWRVPDHGDGWVYAGGDELAEEGAAGPSTHHAAVVPAPAPASNPDAADDDDDDANDVEPPLAGIDEGVWRALPAKLRAEHAEVSAERLEASEHNEWRRVCHRRRCPLLFIQQHRA